MIVEMMERGEGLEENQGPLSVPRDSFMGLYNEDSYFVTKSREVTTDSQLIQFLHIANNLCWANYKYW